LVGNDNSRSLEWSITMSNSKPELAERLGVRAGETSIEALRRKWRAEDPQWHERMEEVRADGQVAELVYEARTAAGLTHAELAKRVGTSAAVIRRLEDADYRGHSLAMLRRVAAALGQQVVVALVPAEAGEEEDAAPAPARADEVVRPAV
jgi:ribosome-binding protein aMBF1 (putative translation factor)